MQDDLNIYGVEYDLLPATYDSFPDIFYMIFNYFQTHFDQFKNLLFAKYKLSNTFTDNIDKPDEEMTMIFNHFKKNINLFTKSFYLK